MPKTRVRGRATGLALVPVLALGWAVAAGGAAVADQSAAGAGAAGTAATAAAARGGGGMRPVEGSVAVGGAERTYAGELPRGRSVPVVVALHGKGSSPRDMAETTGLTEAAAEEGLGVVYPAGLHGGWGDHREPTALRPDPEADMDFLRALVAELVAEHGADPDRVYLAGQSNGANMALRAAAEEPGLFAAVASVAGQLGAVPEPQEPEGGVPLLYVYGTADPLRPYAGLPDPPAPSPDFPEPPIASISAPATVEAFARAAGAEEGRTRRLPDRDPGDGTRVDLTHWRTDDDGRQVAFYRVAGGGHSWPGGSTRHADVQGPISQDFSAADAIAEYFAAH
ncbi:prolyl oligopeptidase family serine peptidase [Streptomonospora sp. S1-112]|uniref:Prolyl oligopeptidase family serine peptidase n=1 Tax=Streptomonospora mangrovi TaxID=2883123 RepID=A0A9X3P089_9ACTN|nr:PHB depolymerase family esterase [Streptomonospora mangrovi]MDA0567456.1 prolyl oligopeptidase family serine peptidase [Streptomonospora mangrovi]